AEKVMDICGEAQVRCILHSYASAAASLGADSLHLPLPLLKDTDAAVIRGFDTLGVSCHSAADVSLAEKLGATYVTAGHIFETDCKRDIPPRGLGLLSDITETANIPVYAIGGINADNIALTKDVGASGACIMSGLMRSDDPAAFIEHLRSRVI
ncbi:MAG: thiamine phosphate synthase, partial [Ruminococcus sp.]|nr:thiamine phosphate synthase [Ruminococcus sp.]